MTHQIGDRLIIDGKSMTLFATPGFPVGVHGIRERSREQWALSCGFCFSTACWRGYIATWEIHNGYLYLRDIIGKYEITHPDPIPAVWVTRKLLVPEGEMLSYVHAGFASTYERSRIITVERGRVVCDVTHSNIRDASEE
ncbi:MAG: hypothetical protein ACKOCK_13255 [Chloroflexota bacterium]